MTLCFAQLLPWPAPEVLEYIDARAKGTLKVIWLHPKKALISLGLGKIKLICITSQVQFIFYKKQVIVYLPQEGFQGQRRKPWNQL